MKIKYLSLTNFRNYKKLDINFEEKIVVLQGNNTQGKSNLIEAIFFLTSAKSNRGGNSMNVINWKENFTRILGEIEKNGQKCKIEIIIIKNNKLQRKIKVNKLVKKQADLTGEFNAVLFSPEDLNLVFSFPSARRRYLNLLISQISWKYTSFLTEFKKVISYRNKLLFDIKKNEAQINQLDFWNEKLVQLGSFIILERKKAIDFYNSLLSETYQKISNKEEKIYIKYLPGLPSKNSIIKEEDFNLTDIYNIFKEKLQKYQQQEIQAGVTLFGPQRDDFKFILTGRDVANFGSQGEQKSVVLATKIVELDFLQKLTGYRPVLLIDDIFSELDKKRRDCILNLIKKQQTIITTTDIEYIKPQFRGDMQIFQIEEGKVVRIN